MITNSQRGQAEKIQVKCCKCLPMKIGAVLLLVLMGIGCLHSIHQVVSTIIVMQSFGSIKSSYDLALILPPEIIAAAKKMR